MSEEHRCNADWIDIANDLEHGLATLRAENERLRAEVFTWKRRQEKTYAACNAEAARAARAEAVVAAADRLREACDQDSYDAQHRRAPEYAVAIVLYDEARAALGEVSTSPAPTDPTAGE